MSSNREIYKVIGDPNNPAQLTDVPDDVLRLMFSTITPEDLVNLQKVNTKLYRALNHPSVWMRLYKLHFPGLFKKLAADANTNWKSLFITAYQERKRKYLHSLIISDDLETFQKKITKLQDLLIHRDEKEYYYAVLGSLGQKKIRDYVYLLALRYYSRKITLAYNFFIRRFRKNHAAQVRLQLNRTDFCRHTILHWAVYCRQPVSVIQALIASGVDVEAKNWLSETAFFSAVCIGYLDAIQILLTASNVNRNCGSMSPLSAAAHCGQVEAVKLLLANGANPNAHHTEHNNTPLLHAAKHRHVDIVRELVVQGADVNAFDSHGKTALEYAATYLDYELAKILVIHGAHFNGFCNFRDHLLLEAAAQGDLEFVKLLFASGAIPHAKDTQSNTAMHKAAANGHVDVMTELFSHEGFLWLDDYRSSDGATPLICAARNNHIEVARLLMQRPAFWNNLNVQTNTGETALDFAEANGNAKFIKLLKDARALRKDQLGLKRTPQS